MEVDKLLKKHVTAGIKSLGIEQVKVSYTSVSIEVYSEHKSLVIASCRAKSGLQRVGINAHAGPCSV